MRNLTFILSLHLPRTTMYWARSGDHWTTDREHAQRFTRGERADFRLYGYDAELVRLYGWWSRDKQAKVTPVARKRYDGRLYVNVYCRNRAYGGPEEGGWWYDTGVPCYAFPSQRFYSEEKARAAARKLNDQFQAEAEERGSYGNYSSVLFDGDLVAHIDEHKPRSYPSVTPHYE